MVNLESLVRSENSQKKIVLRKAFPEKHRFHPGTGDRGRIVSLAAWVSAWPDKEGMEGVAVAISPDWG